MISHPLGLFYHTENDNRILQCEEVMSNCNGASGTRNCCICSKTSALHISFLSQARVRLKPREDL